MLQVEAMLQTLESLLDAPAVTGATGAFETKIRNLKNYLPFLESNLP
jgi:hypothetical protein